MSKPQFITLEQAKYLEKRMGTWIWDGLLFNRDTIVNPKLQLLPNKAGLRILRVIQLAQDLEKRGISTGSLIVNWDTDLDLI